MQRALTLLLAVLMLLGMLTMQVSAAKPSNFTDLNTGAWYYREVAGAIRAGLFNGTGATTFAPDKTFTRAEFVVALANLCEVDTAGQTTKQFTDVEAGSWYYNAVCWAYNKGVTAGVSEHEFAPTRVITRAEICSLLARAIEKVLKVELSAKGAKTFADQKKIPEWAKESVDKCTANGLMAGKDGNKFDPTGVADRAQAACIFYRCYVNPTIFPDHQVEYSIEVSGFTLDFDVDQDYYLCQTKNFEKCKITGFTGFKAITVLVEQYATVYPYKTTAYKLGDALELGYGRAKVTITATYESGETEDYLIAITDPGANEYAYAKAKVNGSANLRAEPNTSAEVLTTLVNNARVYYLETVGDWCKVQQLYTGKIGYIKSDYLRWEWLETKMPAQYKTKIEALQKAHPNWTFSFVDVEMTYAAALEKYGSANAQYINPINYLEEDKIFALMDIDSYNPGEYSAEGIKAMWVNENGFSKATAVEYFTAASESLRMNPYYITCRAILESGYGTSKFAKGTVAGYEGYYNFFGIQCYDNNPEQGAVYAKERNWNSQFRSVVEGANWVKDQYLDQGAITPYFFRYAGFQNKVYMTDVQAPLKEASILKKAYSDPKAKAHFIIPVYRDLP